MKAQGITDSRNSLNAEITEDHYLMVYGEQSSVGITAKDDEGQSIENE